jgi:hypothetical protein
MRMINDIKYDMYKHLNEFKKKLTDEINEGVHKTCASGLQ